MTLPRRIQEGHGRPARFFFFLHHTAKLAVPLLPQGPRGELEVDSSGDRPMEDEAIIADVMQVPAPKPSAPARSWVFLALAAALMVLILAASWASDSRMTQLGWVPRWVAALADRDPNIRTAIPFIPLAFLLVHGFACRGIKRPLMLSLVLCLVCVGVAELGQAFLPGRTGDVRDVLWGGAGGVTGIAAAWLVRRGCGGDSASW